MSICKQEETRFLSEKCGGSGGGSGVGVGVDGVGVGGVGGICCIVSGLV